MALFYLTHLRGRGRAKTAAHDTPEPQLHQNELDKQNEENIQKLLQAYQNWGSLTLAQKEQVLKGLLWMILYDRGML